MSGRIVVLAGSALFAVLEWDIQTALFPDPFTVGDAVSSMLNAGFININSQSDSSQIKLEYPARGLLPEDALFITRMIKKRAFF